MTDTVSEPSAFRGGDEPASVLLERIKREHVKKEAEVKKRKISNKKG